MNIEQNYVKVMVCCSTSHLALSNWLEWNEQSLLTGYAPYFINNVAELPDISSQVRTDAVKTILLVFK